MKRFLLFEGNDYEAGGGWDNLTGRFDTLEEAKAADSGPKRFDWAHVVDLASGEEVWGRRR